MNQDCEFSFYFLVFHTFPRLLHLKMPLKNQDCSSLIRRQFDNFTATHLKREVGWNFFHSLTLIFNIPSSLLDNDNPWYSSSKKVHFLLEMSHAKWGFQEMKTAKMHQSNVMCIDILIFDYIFTSIHSINNTKLFGLHLFPKQNSIGGT